ALEDRKNFADWIMLAFVGKAYDVIKRVAGLKGPRDENQPEIRLQLNAPPELVEGVTKLAAQWQVTPVKAAALLLATAVHNHEIYIQAVTTNWSKAAIRGVRELGKQSEGRSIRGASGM